MPNHKKILLIEDDDFLAKMYQTKLELEGYKVVHAADGEKAIKYLSDPPDLIILDVLLPKIDGFEVLRRIKSKKSTKRIPVIMLTNLSQKEDIKAGLDLGADDYLIKAYFMPSEVIKKVNNLINKA